MLTKVTGRREWGPPMPSRHDTSASPLLIMSLAALGLAIAAVLFNA